MHTIGFGQDFGEEESEFMSGKTKYTDEQLGKLRVVPDFLPSPEKLVHREDTVKVTISLSKSSITGAQEQRPSKR